MTGLFPKYFLIALAAFISTAIAGVDRFLPDGHETSLPARPPHEVAFTATAAPVRHYTALAILTWRKNPERFAVQKDITEEFIAPVSVSESAIWHSSVARTSGRGNQEVLLAIAIQVHVLPGEDPFAAQIPFEVLTRPGFRITDCDYTWSISCHMLVALQATEGNARTDDKTRKRSTSRNHDAPPMFISGRTCGSFKPRSRFVKNNLGVQ